MEGAAVRIQDLARKSDQAARVVEKFGGQTRLAKSLSEHFGIQVGQTTIQSWIDNGGAIPPRYHWLIYELAQREKVKLAPPDFLHFDPDHPWMTRGGRRA